MRILRSRDSKKIDFMWSQLSELVTSHSSLVTRDDGLNIGEGWLFVFFCKICNNKHVINQ